MNLIERNKQPSFHGKKDVKKVEKGKNTHGCLISTPIIDSLRMLKYTDITMIPVLTFRKC